MAWLVEEIDALCVHTIGSLQMSTDWNVQRRIFGVSFICQIGAAAEVEFGAFISSLAINYDPRSGENDISESARVKY